MAKNPTKRREPKFVTVSNRSYGNALKGLKIYFEGKKPRRLQRDGRINFGKNILEILKQKFGAKFRWILTKETDSVTTEYGIVRVRTSERLLDKMYGEQFQRNRDIKNDIINRLFSAVYPSHFTAPTTAVYAPGTLASTLSKEIVPRMSSEDRDAMNKFLPDYIASESLSSINLLKASAQIESLKELAADLDASINAVRSEAWWQTYIRKNILIIQQGYIKAIDKMNISIGTTKFPDFSLITHDNYLDILEIKRPNTEILKHDNSRDNFFWDTEMSKAIIQVENYISNVSAHADAVRSHILDNHKINLKVVRPRGIILAGDARAFADQKQKDDFRLLSQGLKDITIVTYDELLTRLRNYIEVLEAHSKLAKPVKTKKVRAKAAS